MAGRRVVVTAGGTREPIDPVRFLGNRSSGKQGYALATVAAGRSAFVTLVSANATLPAPSGVEVVPAHEITYRSPPRPGVLDVGRQIVGELAPLDDERANESEEQPGHEKQTAQEHDARRQTPGQARSAHEEIDSRAENEGEEDSDEQPEDNPLHPVK